MIKHALFLLLAITGLSFGTQRANDRHAVFKTPEVFKGIRFSYTAERNPKSQTITVFCKIMNDNEVPVDFLVESCYGAAPMVRYDTTKFEQLVHFFCNGSEPRVMTIAEKGTYHFTYYLNPTSEKTVRLGIDFYTVDESFDAEKLTLADLQKPEANQTIVWGEEKEIR